MSRSSTVIGVPCRTFIVEMDCEPADAMGRLDAMLVRAVEGGASTLDSLATVFALPRKILLDVCVGLLGVGALAISDAGSLEVGAEFRRRVEESGDDDDAWLAELRSTQKGSTETFLALQELLRGDVFPYSHRHRTEVPPKLTLPATNSIPYPEDMGTFQLWAAARTHLRGKAPDKRLSTLRVEREEGPGGDGGVSVRRFVLGIEVQKRNEGDADTGEPPSLDVIGPPSLTAPLRRRLAMVLEQFWLTARDEDDPASLAIVEEIDALIATPWEDVDEPDSPIALADAYAMQRAARELLDAAEKLPDDAEELHERMLDLDPVFHAATETTSDARVAETDLIHGDDVYELPLLALRGAGQQVVLSNPWIGRMADEKTISALEDALDRGVNVFLLWGISTDRALDDEIRSALGELMSVDRAGRLSVSLDAPSRIHAKVVTCDCEWAAVATANFLNGVRANATEIALRIRCDENSGHSAVAQIIDWARRSLPDYRHRHRMAVDPTNFGHRSLPFSQVGGPPPHAPQIQAQNVFGSIAVRTWFRAWESRWAPQLEAVALPSAIMVEDGPAHLAWLRHALSTSRERLLIASHRLNPDLVNNAILRAFEACKARGVQCVFVFSPDDDRAGRQAAAVAELQRVGVRVVQTNSHVKALVFDDQSLITSYNFLSRRSRGPREVGLVSNETRVADEVWNLLSTGDEG